MKRQRHQIMCWSIPSLEWHTNRSLPASSCTNSTTRSEIWNLLGRHSLYFINFGKEKTPHNKESPQTTLKLRLHNSCVKVTEFTSYLFLQILFTRTVSPTCLNSICNTRLHFYWPYSCSSRIGTQNGWLCCHPYFSHPTLCCQAQVMTTNYMHKIAKDSDDDLSCIGSPPISPST